MPHEEKHYALDALKDAGERAEASVSEMAALREKLEKSIMMAFWRLAWRSFQPTHGNSSHL